jgi:cation diffusion facilitator family transporter
MTTGGGTRAIFAAMAANAGIAVAKFVAYLVTGSASMLAESIHSVADTSNQGLLLLGGKRAQRVADDRHQFGYGRERYFWAFVVAMVLFALGGLFSIYEGIDKITHPHEIESVAWAIGVLVFAIVVETLSFRTAIAESERVRGDRSWWQFIRQSRSPELPVVLLEDAGALIVCFSLHRRWLDRHHQGAIWDGLAPSPSACSSSSSQ